MQAKAGVQRGLNPPSSNLFAAADFRRAAGWTTTVLFALSIRSLRGAESEQKSNQCCQESLFLHRAFTPFHSV